MSPVSGSGYGRGDNKKGTDRLANEDFFEPPEEIAGREPDARENEARAALEAFFDRHKESVFFSRQLEVRNEGDWYHWITNRALRELAGRGLSNGDPTAPDWRLDTCDVAQELSLLPA